MSELSLGQNALIRATKRSYKPLIGLALVLSLSACSGSAPDNLGISEGRLAPCPSSPNCVSSQASGEHFIEPLAVKGSPAQAQTLLKQVLLSEPGTKLVEESSNYLRAEFTSSLLRFVDDVEFLIDDQAIAVRSASRLGYSDLGVNRKRIEHLRQRLQEQALQN